MANGQVPRRTSLVLPVVLVALGAMFLYANWRPAFDPWPILRTYWPLILVFVGLGKMWDATRPRQNADGTPRSGGVSLGATFGALAFVLVLIILFGHGRAFTKNRRYSGDLQHQTRTVDRQGAKSVDVSMETGSGELNISSGSSHLLDADFNYSESYETPRVDYNVADGIGHLSISQDQGSTHFGAKHNQWNLRLSNDIPLELEMKMGAGQADLDLTGDRKNDLIADLQGGVGQVTIRLPRKVGVVVHASGGIGSVDAHGLRHDDGEYTNEAYGKTPATIRLTVQGGIGQISLIEEP